ncbi:hypothetical protein EYF80_049804 [Liparis tanakae]|uniref:Uncharacterized protein n=1 Tax=Liparis tanakae TaxID=230148 RepID=A0A4Z2FFN5_9TELE|nr:hypothetical protein EYF80_049804 [Liparis tanakae]
MKNVIMLRGGTMRGGETRAPVRKGWADGADEQIPGQDDIMEYLLSGVYSGRRLWGTARHQRYIGGGSGTPDAPLGGASPAGLLVPCGKSMAPTPNSE